MANARLARATTPHIFRSGPAISAKIRTFWSTPEDAAQIKGLRIEMRYFPAAFGSIRTCLSRMTSLRSLYLEAYDEEKHQRYLSSLLTIVPSINNIDELSLVDCKWRTKEGLTATLRRFSSLSRLSLINQTWNETRFERIPYVPVVPRLKSLQLHQVEERINNCPRFQRLDHASPHILQSLLEKPFSSLKTLELGWAKCYEKPQLGTTVQLTRAASCVENLAILPVQSTKLDSCESYS